VGRRGRLAADQLNSAPLRVFAPAA
jgi:hypothetical protein